MNWGGPEFVLAIIGMSLAAGVIRHWISAANGLPEKQCGKTARTRVPAEQAADMRLREENGRLKQRLEASEDRLAVLERIVTDRSFDVAQQIEALRDSGRDTGQDIGRDPAPRRERLEGELNR